MKPTHNAIARGLKDNMNDRQYVYDEEETLSSKKQPLETAEYY